jgi:large subunit ribosomal protein L29
MELEKIRSLGDEELLHHEKTTAEQLFRLRFQVSLGQNDGVKKLRQLRKEVAQIKTVARERELGVRGASKDKEPVREAVAEKKPTARKVAKTVKTKRVKAKSAIKVKTAKTRTKAKTAKAAKAKTEKGAAK